MQPSIAARAATKLAGTVPPHSAYLLLHHPRRPTVYPPKLNALSPLLSAVQLRSAAAGWGLSANVAYLGDPAEHEETEVDADSELQMEADATLFRFDGTGTGTGRGYRLARPLRLADLDLDATGMEDALALRDARPDATPHLLVCTHAARDCRCGETGGAVVAALRLRADAGRVRVGEVGHVGGHKYAANVLLFPIGDWFGNIQPSHVPLLVQYACDVGQGRTVPPPELVPHWRGGRGLGKDAQVALAAEWLALYGAGSTR